MAPCYGSARGVPARLLLGLMAFLMFAVTQMVRLNLNIAIVAMRGDADGWNRSNGSQEQDGDKMGKCFLGGTREHGRPAQDSAAQTAAPVAGAWPQHAAGLLLGAFYWSYWLTELPGGLLAQRAGGRRTLAVGVLLAGCLNLALPAACRAHYWAAAAVRALQGLALGVTWPAMHSLSAHWIPKTERSKFMTSYHGASVGTALTYPLSGFVIAYLGWEYVFYIVGALSVIWCIVWWFLVYDSPADHPRISQREKMYLEEHIGKSVSMTKSSPLKTPWTSILSSGPFWAVLVASQGLMWGSITLSMQMPEYFHTLHKLDIKTNGLVSGIPDLSKFIFGLVFSTAMDYTLKKELLTITMTRKISVAVCEFLPAILLVVLACVGSYNAAIAAALLSFSTAVGGASSSGSLANIVDLSPNFAGTILGLIKVLTFIPGVVSPMIVSILASKMDKPDIWPYVFGILACIYTVCCTVFLIFGSGEIQPWNESTEQRTTELEDLMENAHNEPTGDTTESKK